MGVRWHGTGPPLCMGEPMESNVVELINVYRGTEVLHPLCRMKFQRLEIILSELYGKGELKSNFAIYESWRSPKRQNQLLASKGNVTKAAQWYSSHQYGLACDFAVCLKKGWNWDAPARDWAILREQAHAVGLEVPIPGWDPGHVEAPEWRSFRALLP